MDNTKKTYIVTRLNESGVFEDVELCTREHRLESVLTLKKGEVLEVIEPTTMEVIELFKGTGANIVTCS